MPEPTDTSEHLVCLGLNYRTTPVEVREKVAFPEAQVPVAVREVLDLPGFSESVVLSTCNRVELYAAHLSEGTRLFPGFESVLATLEASGTPWGIVTNKPGWLTRPLLEALGLSGRAACAVSGDTVAERKPHPLPLLHAAGLLGIATERCVYVGDAERDGERAGRSITFVAPPTTSS
jgi:phosphoglycolate phosphatase-like HAD superfamily hydrolase